MSKGLAMKKVAIVLSMFVLFLTLGSTGWAQYPTKPITFLMGWAAGGITDVTGRALYEAASKTLGQPIVVVNKPGGTTAVSLAQLKNEKPDGYTLAVLSPGSILSQHVLKVSYDLTKDFTFIMAYGENFGGVVVQANSPWKTFRELIDYAKANPGKIRYSSPGAASPHNMPMAALGFAEGIKWTHVPFAGSHPSVMALLGGHVDATADSTTWKPHVDSGKLRLLSTYCDRRMSSFPNVPTWLELGYNVSVKFITGIIGPKGIPKPIVDKLHEAFKEAMNDPKFKKTIDIYEMISYYRDSEGLAKDVKELSEQWGKLVPQIGLKPE